MTPSGPNSSCPLCDLELPHSPETMTGGEFKYECDACGAFSLGANERSQTPPAVFNESPHLISHALRLRSDAMRAEGRQSEYVYRLEDRPSDGSMIPLPRRWSVTEQLNATLLAIAERTKQFGSSSTLRRDHDWPLVQAHSWQELDALITHWFSQDAVKIGHGAAGRHQSVTYTLTGKGWEIVDRLRPSSGRDSLQVFIAAKSDLESSCVNAIKRAIRACGRDPYRVEDAAFDGKICDHLVAEIRKSALVIADSTGARPNVFYEAGFALGLGIPVIWTVRAEGEDDPNLPFDVRQYQHIVWHSAVDLEEQLTDRINARYPRQP